MGDVVNFEAVTWMQKVIAKNNDLAYYTIGKVKDKKNTLLVTAVKGNGGAMFFCQTHDEVYPIKSRCAQCQNAVVDVPADASVTSCDTPEIQR
jgi:acyl CoA:acetate/3-ketoacid CoA transferase beta subunit